MIKKIDSKGINSKKFYTEHKTLTHYLRLDSCRTASGKSLWLGKRAKHYRIILTIIAAIFFITGLVYTVI